MAFGKAPPPPVTALSQDKGASGLRDVPPLKPGDSNKRISVFQDGQPDTDFFSFLKEAARVYFKGELVHEKKSGHCLERFANGASRDGTFRNDLLEGPAVIVSPAGEEFTGEFMAGRPLGSFSRRLETGEVQKGVIQGNKFLQKTVVVVDNFEVSVLRGEETRPTGEGILTSRDQRFVLTCQFQDGAIPNPSRCRMLETHTAQEKFGMLYVGQKRECLMIADDAETFQINPLKKKIKNMMISIPAAAKGEGSVHSDK